MNQRQIFSLRTVITLTCLVGLSTISSRALAQDCDGNGLPDFVDENGAIYITNEFDSSVWRVDLPGGPLTRILDLNDSLFLSGIDVDAVEDKVYIVVESEGAIYRCNLDGTGLETNWQTGINEPNDVAIRGPGSVYATRQNTVTIFPPAQFSVALSFPYTVDAIDEDYAVAFAIGSSSILRILDGPIEPVTTQTLVTGVSLATGLAYSNNQVFWADQGDDTIKRADVGAGQNLNVTTLFTAGGSTQITGVAANRDDDQIYFATQSPNTLYRINADGTGLIPVFPLPGGFEVHALAYMPKAPDCNNNGTQDACDITDPSHDCNGDLILDACQIDGSTDLNNNGVLDECEPDCDLNGRPDDYDLTQGAGDCNSDGVLDRCDTAPLILFSDRVDSLNFNVFTTTSGSDVAPFFVSDNVDRAEVDQITGKIYWSRNGELRRADMDSSNSELIPLSENAQLMKVDSLSRRLYFATGNLFAGWVTNYLNLDNLTEETSLSAITPPSTSSPPKVDTINRWLFYANNGIHRVDFSGTNSVLLSSEGSVVDYDPNSQTVYFEKNNTVAVDSIWRMNADGSNAVELFDTTDWTFDVELDWPTNTLYYVRRNVSDNGPPYVLLEAIFKKQLDSGAPPVQVTDWVSNNPTRTAIRGLIRQPIDCNENGVPDSCESLSDCNSDGIPDVCQIFGNDCNVNGVLDECEFGAADCNANGVFDGCDLTPTYDQVNTPPGGFGAINIQSPREQTFRPFTDVLAGFDIGLVPGSQNLAGDTLSVGVYRNAVLLEETAQFVPAEFVGMFTFLLPAPVPVTPGETLSLIVQGGTFLEFSWQYTSIDTYPFGHRIHAGSPNGDFVFRTIELAPASQDCNANGVPDDCELAGNDCNNDGIPDECQLMPDCNSNGVPDDCDTAVADCNGDGIPDDCQLAANDCNGDGVPDECNLAQGGDCNNNGTVDECEFEPQIDQSNLDESGGGGNFQQGNNAGQTFTPTFGLLEAIEVGLLDNTSPGNGEFITLRLLRGTDVLATVGQTVIAPAPPLTRFTLDEPIVVTPGELLEFQLNDTGFIRFFWKQGPVGSSYEGGQGTFFGGSYNHDRVFQTLGREVGWGDCNQNNVPDDCEVLVNDCNNNGLIDDCEGLPDCNLDGIPDECQLAGNDCNGDGVLDVCQPGADCNANGILDTCEVNGGHFTLGAEPNLAIPDSDPAGVQSVINVPASGMISDIDVNLHITHTWQGDVVATLSHNGTTVTLINHSGASSVGCTGNAFGYQSDNFGTEGTPLVLDDSAPVSIDCYNGPASTIAVNNYAGPAMPNEPLAAFSGMDLSGDWILTVSDPFAQEVGTLVSWSLDIETTGTDCNANGVFDACESSGGSIFAMDDLNDEIVPLNEDGSSAGPSIPLPGGVYRAIAVDRQLGKIYYGNISTNQIYRVNLDGTGTELLVDAPAGRAITIEIDAVNDRIYWVGSSSIYRSFGDGSGVELLVTSLTGASGLDLDVAGGRMYFTEQSAGRIKSANLDGSDVQTLINSGLTSPVEIAVDPAGGKFYFTQFNGLVRRANLDGSGLEDIYTLGANCAGIQLDLADGKVYFSDTSPDEILRMNLDGSSLESVANVANAYRFFLSPFSADCNGNGILDECETGPLGCGPGEECDAAAQVTEGVTLGTLADNLGTTGNDDSCGGANNTIDEWLEFTPDVSTLATFTTCNPGTEFDSVLAVFDGCPQTGGTQLACNDDTVGAPPECGLGGSNLNRKSTIHLDVIAGQAYLIRVSVYNDSFAVQGGFGPNYELSIGLCSKGDLNGDDLVDLLDVPLFVDALLDPATATPDAACGADMNDDGQVNGLDTQWFTNALMGS